MCIIIIIIMYIEREIKTPLFTFGLNKSELLLVMALMGMAHTILIPEQQQQQLSL